MKLANVIALLSVAASASVLASTPVQPIPDRFLGDWGRSLEDCGGDTDDMRLRIERDRVSFFASNGPLTSVDVRSGDEVAVVVELSDEGETWLLRTTFRLSQDGDLLTVQGTPEDAQVTRVRCESILG